MHYRVIFDISQKEFPQSLWFSAFVFAILCFGIAIISWRLRRRIRSSPVLGIIFVLAGSPIGFLRTYHDYRNYSELKTALQKSQCAIAEGTVTQFQNMPWSKGTGNGETFVVNGAQFKYRENSAQNGFHQTGIIHDGMQVRIYYFTRIDPVDKDITRLEIAE
jgi:hypothetical protein